MPIRVLIADDHAILRSGLRLLLEQQTDVEVVAEVEDGYAAVEAVERLRPDLLLLDITMPKLGGLEVIKRIQRSGSRTKVLVLTMHDDVGYLRQFMQAGAMGYITKGSGDRELVRAIRAVVAGRKFVDPTLAQEAVFELLDGDAARSSEGARANLSERELEVLRLVALGYTNKESGERLHLSVKTVETYRLRLMQKLRLRTRADLVAYALREGLLEDS